MSVNRTSMIDARGSVKDEGAERGADTKTRRGEKAEYEVPKYGSTEGRGSAATGPPYTPFILSHPSHLRTPTLVTLRRDGALTTTAETVPRSGQPKNFIKSMYSP